MTTIVIVAVFMIVVELAALLDVLLDVGVKSWFGGLRRIGRISGVLLGGHLGGLHGGSRESGLNLCHLLHSLIWRLFEILHLADEVEPVVDALVIANETKPVVDALVMR